MKNPYFVKNGVFEACPEQVRAGLLVTGTLWTVAA